MTIFTITTLHFISAIYATSACSFSKKVSSDFCQKVFISFWGKSWRGCSSCVVLPKPTLNAQNWLNLQFCKNFYNLCLIGSSWHPAALGHAKKQLQELLGCAETDKHLTCIVVYRSLAAPAIHFGILKTGIWWRVLVFRAERASRIRSKVEYHTSSNVAQKWFLIPHCWASKLNAPQLSWQDLPCQTLCLLKRKDCASQSIIFSGQDSFFHDGDGVFNFEAFEDGLLQYGLRASTTHHMSIPNTCYQLTHDKYDSKTFMVGRICTLCFEHWYKYDWGASVCPTGNNLNSSR